MSRSRISSERGGRFSLQRHDLRALRYFPSSSFSPLSLGPALWLRGDLGITLNGSNVSAWADQSGNGRDATQAVAGNQPAWASGTYKGIDGAAGNRFMSLASKLIFGTAATIVSVCTAQSTAAGYVWSDGTGNNAYLSNHSAIGDLEWFNTAGDRQMFVDDPVIPNRYRLITLQTDGVSLIGRSNSSQTFSKIPPQVPLDGLQIIGAANSAPASPYRGIVHEIIVITRVISVPELTSLEAYLAARWT